MADYAVTGKKRTGKSLVCVGYIRDALKEGRKVATNLNLNLDKLMPPDSRITVTRIPDKPTVHDLKALGRGQDGVDDEHNGLIVLDECSHYFNARSYQDKDRQAVLDWLTVSGKLGWDVFYLMQGLPQLDKQIRDTQIEYHMTIKRTDKWRIPGITFITGLLFGEKRAIRFPKFRIATVRQGIDRDAFFISRKFFKAEELYPAYETQQQFHESQPQHEWRPDVFSPGLHTMLSAWHLHGRYLKPEVRLTWQLLLTLPASITVFYVHKLLNAPVPTIPDRRCPRTGAAR